MGREELLRQVAGLGREFTRRGMHAHVQKLRIYYLALRHRLDSPGRREVELRWSEELVIEWLKVLQVPPYAGVYPIRARGSGCGRCEKTTNDRTAVHTERTFPGGSKMSCQSCGEIWLEQDAPG